MNDEPVSLSFGSEDINEMTQRAHLHQVSEGGKRFRGNSFLVAPGHEGMRGDVCRTCVLMLNVCSPLHTKYSEALYMLTLRPEPPLENISCLGRCRGYREMVVSTKAEE